MAIACSCAPILVHTVAARGLYEMKLPVEFTFTQNQALAATVLTGRRKMPRNKRNQPAAATTA